MLEYSLIQLLRDNIIKQKNIINEYYSYQDEDLSKKEDLVKRLEGSVNNITNVDFAEIQKIINTFMVTDDVKEDLTNKVKVAYKILELNNTKGTNIELDNDQFDALNSFLNNLHYYINVRKNFNINNTIDIKTKELEVDKYTEILSILTNSKDKYITDLESIKRLFVESGITEKEKREILLFLIEYNREVYNYINSEDSKQKLPVAKVKEIFKKYNYDFLKIDKNYQKEILNGITLEKLDEMLEVIDQNFDRVDNDYILKNLILYSNRQTINEIVSLAKRKKITPEELLKIPSALILEEDNDKDQFLVNNTSNSYIAPAANNFIRNIALLERYGLFIKTVYDRCKELLVSSNDVLTKNLELFLEYGFSYNKIRKDKVLENTLTALLSENFAEIVDQFIEIHPLGLKYLRDNLSVVRSVKRADDILFYNIYQSIKKYGPKSVFKVVVSNDIEYLCLNKDLSKNNYLGITYANKVEMTNTYVPTFIDKSKYLDAVKNGTNSTINVDIFDNKYIQKINKYSDRLEPLIYNFDGLVISKLKVLRVYSNLLQAGKNSDDAFIFALTYNTILDKASYDKLVRIIKE